MYKTYRFDSEFFLQQLREKKFLTPTNKFKFIVNLRGDSFYLKTTCKWIFLASNFFENILKQSQVINFQIRTEMGEAEKFYDQ